MSVVLACDGTNIVMRCAFARGGPDKCPPDAAARTAVTMIERARESVSTDPPIASGLCPVVVALDSGGPTWRHERFPDYKGNRDPAIRTEKFSVELLELGNKAGWLCLCVGGYEADDLLATYVNARWQERHLFVLSGDSDLLGLCHYNTTVLRPAGKGAFNCWGFAQVWDEYGVVPQQLPSYKALVGEPGDNLPGVPGIGPKKAAALLQRFGTIENIVAYAMRVPGSRDVERISEYREQAYRMRELATLRETAPLPGYVYNPQWQESTGL